MDWRSLVARAALGAAALLLAPASRAATLTTVYAFHKGNDGAAPEAPLLNVGGILYGTTSAGGKSHFGTVFKIDPATGAESVVHSFAGGKDGEYPFAALIKVGGTLYGTTYLGGGVGCYGNGCGTVFMLDPTTRATAVLHAFDGSDGAFPLAAPLFIGGDLYGIATLGGALGYGTVYQTQRATGETTVLHSFKRGTDGALPYATLTNVDGMLYGTTYDGGASDLGTIFKLDPRTKTETVLHSFADKSDGAGPTGAALIDVSGLLYGTTPNGGTSGVGTVFSINPAKHADTILHAFGGRGDGTIPQGALLRVGTILYGTTAAGGASGYGTVYKIDPTSGTETVLYSFSGGKDGANPVAALINVDGTLYGTTAAGGAAGNGTVFSLTR